MPVVIEKRFRLTRVSVVIPCRNEAKHITTFLDSVLQQKTGGIDLEIVLSDGMSDDGTREIVARYQNSHPQLIVIDNPERIVSTGLNAAIRSAHGEIIARMDCHTEYAADYLQKCVKLLRDTGADNVGGPARTKADGWIARSIAAAYHSPFSSGGAKFHDENYEGYVDTVTYGCWYKSTLERLGLFDERLVRNQDDELNLRLIRSGGAIWQSPQIVSWYRPRGKVSSLFRQYFQYGFWKVPVIRKYRIPASWRHLAPGAFMMGNVFLVVLSIAGIVSGHGRLSSSCALALAVSAALYGGASVIASVLAARRHGWPLLLLLPLVFFVYHASYGLGFLLGLFYWSVKPPDSTRMAGAFTEITR
jgi:succinoglycan biosynthesis protein ExoA